MLALFQNEVGYSHGQIVTSFVPRPSQPETVLDTHSSLRGFQRNRSNASLIMKDYGGRSRVHLTVPNERVSFRTSKGAVVKIDFTFHYSILHPLKVKNVPGTIARYHKKRGQGSHAVLLK